MKAFCFNSFVTLTINTKKSDGTEEDADWQHREGEGARDGAPPVCGCDSQRRRDDNGLRGDDPDEVFPQE